MNHYLFHALNNLTGKSGFLDGLFVFFAAYADMFVIAVAVLFLAWVAFDHRHDPKTFTGTIFWEGADIFISVALSWLFVIALKLFFHIPRPAIVIDALKPLMQYGAYESFPSGHAAVFFALATAIWLYHRGAGWFFFLCALMIALSRIIVGIHFPGDILAGALLGSVVSYLVFFTIGSSVHRR